MERESENENRTETLATQAKGPIASETPYVGGWVTNDENETFFCRLGAHKRTSDIGSEQDLRVSKIISHPSYHKPLSYSHDITLLKLEKPAQLNKYGYLPLISVLLKMVYYFNFPPSFAVVF